MYKVIIEEPTNELTNEIKLGEYESLEEAIEFAQNTDNIGEGNTLVVVDEENNIEFEK